ncbi:MAG: 1-acyl-sn-glycerol-3-phosphate acyltransferase, partial [Clostridia bacterium]|nr:1-acyl-sn-glycerol-3-phosphate acyltransferase [Clostridia bacterium]
KIIKKPSFIYNVLGFVWKTFIAPKYNVSYKFNCDIKKDKGPYILISNHASRLDYIFTGVPQLPARLNYDAGYNEFFRSHLAGVFSLLKVIPKKNFTPDIYTIKSIKRILSSGGKVAIFPEGMSSISGANQPIVNGTGKFLKHFNVPVYYSIIKGGYLTSPKYNLKDREGKVEVEFYKLFEKEDLSKYSPEEMEDIINKTLYHDDYKWNKEQKNKYNLRGNGAEGLETLLFWCPKCNKQHGMKSEGDKIYCTNCGNGATLTETYEMLPFDKSCVIPETQTQWFNKQREVIKEEVKAENYSICEKVKLGKLDKYKKLKDQKTSEIVGEGVVIIDKTGLTYQGTKNGEEYNFHISLADLPTYGMCTDVSRFYTFYKGEFVEFYPENPVTEKIFLVTEELHRLHGGKWQDFKFEK